MALIIKVETAGELCAQFARVGRGNSFSYEGFVALIEYFDEGDTELDVIGIDSEFSEDSIDEFLENYSVPVEENYRSYILNEVKSFIEMHGGWYKLISNDTRIVYQAIV